MKFFLDPIFLLLFGTLVALLIASSCGGKDYWNYIFRDSYGLGASIRSKGRDGVVLCGSQGCKEVSWNEMYKMYPSDKEVINRMRKDE